jgi:hypothetical protein
MTPNEQRELIRTHLQRREQIKERTRASLETPSAASTDQLERVDPLLFEEEEDAFYKKQGKTRYRTSDGRTLFLTPPEIEQRRRARSRKASRPRGRHLYSRSSEQNRRLIGISFNIGAILLALMLVYLILR